MDGRTPLREKINALFRDQPNMSNKRVASKILGATGTKELHSIAGFRRRWRLREGLSSDPASRVYSNSDHLGPLREATAAAGITGDWRGYAFASTWIGVGTYLYCGRIQIPGRPKEISIVGSLDTFSDPVLVAATVRSLRKILAASSTLT